MHLKLTTPGASCSASRNFPEVFAAARFLVFQREAGPVDAGGSTRPDRIGACIGMGPSFQAGGHPGGHGGGYRQGIGEHHSDEACRIETP